MALSRIATLFDPLGFWAPDIIQGKIIMQELWLQGLEQNDRLRLKFMHWCNELEQISETEVPRCLQMNLGKQEVVLHVFSDASNETCSSGIFRSKI